MLTIYRSREGKLETVAAATDGCWFSLVDPTPEEVARVQAELAVPEDLLTDALDRGEQARTEREDGAALMVLRVPYFQGEDADIPHLTVPLGIVTTDRFLATVCTRDVGVLRQLSSGAVRGLSTAKHNRFILQALHVTAQRFLHHLGEINRAVDALEDRLQASLRNRELLELLKRQKSLVYFTEALKSNEVMLERLQRSQVLQAYPDDQELLEDVLTEFRQAMEMTTISANILSNTMDAFASIISEQPERRREVPGVCDDHPGAADAGGIDLRNERGAAAAGSPGRLLDYPGVLFRRRRHRRHHLLATRLAVTGCPPCGRGDGETHVV
jgi:magnesium transporter